MRGSRGAGLHLQQRDALERNDSVNRRLCAKDNLSRRLLQINAHTHAVLHATTGFRLQHTRDLNTFDPFFFLRFVPLVSGQHRKPRHLGSSKSFVIFVICPALGRTPLPRDKGQRYAFSLPWVRWKIACHSWRLVCFSPQSWPGWVRPWRGEPGIPVTELAEPSPHQREVRIHLTLCNSYIQYQHSAHW